MGNSLSLGLSNQDIASSFVDGTMLAERREGTGCLEGPGKSNDKEGKRKAIHFSVQLECTLGVYNWARA